MSDFVNKMVNEVDVEIATLENQISTLRQFRAALVPPTANGRKGGRKKGKKRGRPTNAEKAAREAAAAVLG